MNAYALITEEIERIEDLVVRLKEKHLSERAAYRTAELDRLKRIRLLLGMRSC